MAFAPALLAPPDEQTQDAALVANVVDPVALGASQVLPPPPLPAPAANLPVDALMSAASAPLPAVPPTPVDAALAPALPPAGGPALSVLPPPDVAAGTPGTPVEAAKKRVGEVDALGREIQQLGDERTDLEKQQADQKAQLANERQAALSKLQERQELHRTQAANTVAELRAKAETEPYHTFWESRSIGQNIATGIGLILGGVSWNPNHVNRGIQIVENMMAQDLALQKEKHADLWRQVEAAERGEKALDARELRETAAFSAAQGAKADAVAGRLGAMIAANKGKGDTATAKKAMLTLAMQADQHYQNATSAEAAAAHLKELEKEAEEANRIREIRANKYKTKGGGTGSGVGGLAGKVDIAAAKLQTEIDSAIRAGKPLSPGEIKTRGVAAGIPLNPTKSIKTSIKGILEDTVRETAKGSSSAFSVTTKDADESLAIRDATGIRGYASSKKDVSKFNKDRINTGVAIESLEDIAKQLKTNAVSGYDIPKGSLWDKAVLAIAATTTAGQTDTNVAHEAGTLKNKLGVVDLKAVESKIDELKRRQQSFYDTLAPVKEGTPGVSPHAKIVKGTGDGSSAEFPDKILEGVRYKYDSGKGKYVKDVLTL